jgi:predicted ATPase
MTTAWLMLPTAAGPQRLSGTGRCRQDPVVLFVGRARASSRLLAAVEDAAAGYAQLVLVLVLVSGEAGMGKTALIRVAAARSGLVVGWGTCVEAERTPAFWPWSSALRGVLGTLSAAETAELTPRVTEPPG